MLAVSCGRVHLKSKCLEKKCVRELVFNGKYYFKIALINIGFIVDLLKNLVALKKAV